MRVIVAIFFCLLVSTGCSIEPEQYREYKYDVYSQSGELFTTVTVRSAGKPSLEEGMALTGSGNRPTGKTIIRSGGFDGELRSGDVVIPSGWLVVEHGKQLGQ